MQLKQLHKTKSTTFFFTNSRSGWNCLKNSLGILYSMSLYLSSETGVTCKSVHYWAMQSKLGRFCFNISLYHFTSLFVILCLQVLRQEESWISRTKCNWNATCNKKRASWFTIILHTVLCLFWKKKLSSRSIHFGKLNYS